MGQAAIGGVQKGEGVGGDTQALHCADGLLAPELGDSNRVQAWMIGMRTCPIGNINDINQQSGNPMGANESAATDGFVILVGSDDDATAACAGCVVPAAQS